MSTETTALRVPAEFMTVEKTLPADWPEATLIGRAQTPVGPSVVVVGSNGYVYDITNSYATTRDLFEEENPAEAAKHALEKGAVIGKVNDILANSATRNPNKPFLLSPVDFQEIEAAGVTFAASMVERIIEEACKGDPKKAPVIRKAINDALRGKDLSELKPGSPEATAIKGFITKPKSPLAFGLGKDQAKIVMDLLTKPTAKGGLIGLSEEEAKPIQEILTQPKAEGGLGLSHHYVEVGLGAEGEIFSKASAGLSVGHGAQAGYTSDSGWTNPEPEIVMIANSKGKIVGAAVGNDVNDRAKEGNSALLLHRAKVKNGSTAIGPFIRLFDDKFSMKDVENDRIHLKVTHADGRVKFDDTNDVSQISRSPAEIVAAAMDDERTHHNGLAVYLGTMIVPSKDASTVIPGKEDEAKTFTHDRGDIVTIGSKKLGHITNIMLPAREVKLEEKGLLDLARNLASRGVLIPKEKHGFAARELDRAGAGDGYIYDMNM